MEKNTKYKYKKGDILKINDYMFYKILDDKDDVSYNIVIYNLKLHNTEFEMKYISTIGKYILDSYRLEKITKEEFLVELL